MKKVFLAGLISITALTSLNASSYFEKDFYEASYKMESKFNKFVKGVKKNHENISIKANCGLSEKEIQFHSQLRKNIKTEDLDTVNKLDSIMCENISFLKALGGFVHKLSNKEKKELKYIIKEMERESKKNIKNLNDKYPAYLQNKIKVVEG